MYVYIKTEPGVWTVGYTKPNGDWDAESDHNSREVAASRCNYLNGNHAAVDPDADVIGRILDTDLKSVRLQLEHERIKNERLREKNAELREALLAIKDAFLIVSREREQTEGDAS